MAHFYGWTPSVIDNMTYKQYAKYSKCVQLIEAEQAMRDMHIVTSPNLKADKFKGLFNYFKKVLDEGLNRNRGPISYDELMVKIKGAMNGK